ncbi:dTDP-4-amino-4,6-dideoxygalactose transaminase [Singulisphaera sp. GP187]|uniref:DegT/DnrJ/EryC1/StrS family aminotransferase n=1 Tax=Singulisphaera sp. GP187 TaxID=1882752 RepID=UPI0009270E60|nr:DegT/DnrJ/EryC1/StrS family aminotransferase [Singulisphaera sp. GP187]SIO43896.1 dTDP-4-amino-4,6-dideoxygalactose transaminase [Singulisphaera sp. GP187]
MRRDPSKQRPEATRRTVLQTAGALAAGLLTQSTTAQGATENLALQGGPPAVTTPSRKQVEAARWPIFGAEEEQAIVDLVRNPGYGPIAALEADWKDYFQAPFVKAQCNGTSAIAAMFFALDLPPGSEIMVPSYTFFASIVPMRVFGLVPRFVDVNPRTLNFDVDDAKRRLTKNTKAVFPVHWMGLPCAMDEINDFAAEHGLAVLEDVAHSPGASLKGKPMGTWGRMSIFSYQASKPIPAMEGGMGMYQNREDYERATTFGHSDLPPSFPANSPYRKFEGSGLGLKFRMNPMAAVLARAQLRKLKARNEDGVAQVRKLNERITQLPGLVEPTIRSDMTRLYYSSNILFLDEAKAGFTRAALVKALQAEGVKATAHRYRLQHKLPLYQDAAWWHHAPVIPNLPGSDEANRTAIGLPYFTSEVPELVEQYAQAFEKVWAHRKQLAES